MCVCTDMDHLTNVLIIGSFSQFFCFPQVQYLLQDVALDHTRLNKIPFQVRLTL